MATLQERAEKLSRDLFLGGPVKDFAFMGRMQLATLLDQGLGPDSRVLDVGCGCLRGGYWLIHFLDPNRYFGIEPNRKMLEAGLHHILEPGLAEEKGPRFDHNPEFDFSVFGETFDYFLARSVWTHAAKGHIRKMLDSFVETAADGGVFLTSYVRAGLLKNRDYGGEDWVGRSHESDLPGWTPHSFKWIRRECLKRGLAVRELRERVVHRQIWLRIDRRPPEPQ